MYKKFLLIVITTLFFFTNSCGTILKPERINKKHSDNLDTPIVILDAIGLLFFVIPGVVSFMIDYSNGTLYE